MKRTFIAVAAAFALALGVAGCAPSASSGTDMADTGGAEAAAAPGSLRAAHTAGQLDGTDDYANKFCLSCHPRETINAANDGYGGNPDFNPHKTHLAAGDCTSCHSLDGPSVLSCNECHDAPLPDGWESAPRGSGPLHKLFS